MVFSSLAQAGEERPRCLELRKELDAYQETHQSGLAKQKELEEQFKKVLKQEILAQVEKRDRSAEEGEAKKVYYELRRIRAEVERAITQVSRIRKIYCPNCPPTGLCEEGKSS